MRFRGIPGPTAGLITIALLCLQIRSLAQISLSIMEKGQFVQMPVLPRDYLFFPNITLEQEFNSSKFANDDIKSIADQPDDIEEILMVFTTFKLSETFSQSELNKKRIEKFCFELPEICADKRIKWKFIAQTASKTEEQARTFFHGFIIVPKIKKSAFSRSAELKMISDISSLMSSVKTGSDTVKKIKCRKSFSGKYLPVSKRKQKSGVLYAQKGMWSRKRMMTEKCDTFDVVNTYYKSLVKPEAYNFITDTIVSAVLNRNSHWKNMALVIDVTGSMSPYTADVILWANLNQHWRRVRHLTCFNDGDTKPDYLKVAGKTGGIYHSKIDSSDGFEKLIYATMRKGGGGDSQENDIEGLIASQKDFPQAGELILICDNWSPMRDIKHLDQLNKPVHVIVCGSAFRLIHPEYIQLAYQTGGSVHTIEDDFTNLYRYIEGDVIKLGNSKYRVRNGSFKLLSFN